MCGIAGCNLSQEEHGIDMPKLASQLLLGIEHRGRDATGAAWFEGETLMVQKDPMPASQFVRWCDLPIGASNVILHTRFGTKGSEKDNNNNHPVVSGNIVGVHNGVVYNDDELFKRMGLTEHRVAEVDTEAIFASIAYGTTPSDPENPNSKARLANTIPEVLEEIEGNAAIAWFTIEGDPDLLHIARISSSPLVVARSKGGSIVFCSELDPMRKAMHSVGMEIENFAYMKEGTFFSIKQGQFVDEKKFIPAWSRSYAWSSGNDYYKKQVTSSGYKGVIEKVEKKVETVTKAVDTVVRNVHALTTWEDDDKEEFTPYVSDESLFRHVRSALLGTHLEVMEDDEFLRQYRNRFKEITEYEDQWGEKDAEEMGSILRPGVWVQTYMSTSYGNLHAQVYLLPQCFPGGTFVLRVMLPNSRYKSGYEMVLVERCWGEFEITTGWDDMVDDTDTDTDTDTDDDDEETLSHPSLVPAQTVIETLVNDDEDDDPQIIVEHDDKGSTAVVLFSEPLS